MCFEPECFNTNHSLFFRKEVTMIENNKDTNNQDKEIDLSDSLLKYPDKIGVVAAGWCDGALCSFLCTKDSCQSGCESGDCKTLCGGSSCRFWIGSGG